MYIKNYNLKSTIGSDSSDSMLTCTGLTYTTKKNLKSWIKYEPKKKGGGSVGKHWEAIKGATFLEKGNTKR